MLFGRLLSSLRHFVRLIHTQFLGSKAGKLATISVVVLLLASTGAFVAWPDSTPAAAKQPTKKAVETKVSEMSQPAIAMNPLYRSSEVPRPPGTPSQPRSNTSPEPPHVAPPFISAATIIEDATLADSPTCDFTAVVTASALYHSGQSPYASHVITFTLTLQPSNGSASFSQTFTHTFTHGETKQFRFSHSFNKPVIESTYQVKAIGTMTLSSGSASLGPATTYNVTGSCGPRSPAP